MDPIKEAFSSPWAGLAWDGGWESRGVGEVVIRSRCLRVKEQGSLAQPQILTHTQASSSSQATGSRQYLLVGARSNLTHPLGLHPGSQPREATSLWSSASSISRDVEDSMSILFR